MEKEVIKRVKCYVVLTAAAVIYAAAISLFLDPNNIARGCDRYLDSGKPVYWDSNGYIEYAD